MRAYVRSQFVPALTLLHPRDLTLWVVGTVAAAVAIGAYGMTQLHWPLWIASATFLGLLLVPGVFKWRADARRYGWVVMTLGILLVAQGFHSIEHIAQFTQYHILNWTARASTGLLSAANSEWVHFVWNWAVLIAVLILLRNEVWNVWIWLLFAWVTAHTFEHTYMFVQYLSVLHDLQDMGVNTITAQGLPGILGSDGWLARSPQTQGMFLCRIPGLTTASRIDVHFVWNMGEMILLWLTANAHLRSVLPGQPTPPRQVRQGIMPIFWSRRSVG